MNRDKWRHFDNLKLIIFQSLKYQISSKIPNLLMPSEAYTFNNLFYQPPDFETRN